MARRQSAKYGRAHRARRNRARLTRSTVTSPPVFNHGLYLQISVSRAHVQCEIKSTLRIAPVPECACKPQSEREQTRGGSHKNGYGGEAVENQSVDGDAERLAEIERGGKNRHRGAARLRCHLCSIGLQRV